MSQRARDLNTIKVYSKEREKSSRDGADSRSSPQRRRWQEPCKDKRLVNHRICDRLHDKLEAERWLKRSESTVCLGGKYRR